MNVIRSLCLYALAGLTACMLSACEDPSAVGLDLVGSEGGVPRVSPVAIDSMRLAELDGIVDNTTYVLAGMVDDPVLGLNEANGYIDFLDNLTMPAAYRQGPLDALLLRLELTTVYGDTTASVTYALHEVLDEFDPVGETPETLPALGPEILQFSVFPTDESVLISVPIAHFAGRDTTFRSLTFSKSFHGFHVRPVSGNAAVGIQNGVTSRTNLRGVVGTDTVSFLVTKGITQYRRFRPPALPAGLEALQQGVGPHLSFNLDLSPYEGAAVNRASFQLTADTLVFANDPAGFVRPEIENLGLYGVFSDTTSIILALGTWRDDGITMDFDSPSFREALQSVLRGANPFERFEIRFLFSAGNTLGGIVFHTIDAGTRPPNLYVTTTSIR